MFPSALVLLSGGQDSVTCLAIALEKYPRVEALCFDYGQRHRIEIEQAKKVAEIAGVGITVLPLPILSQLNDNALTRSDIAIVHMTGGLPNTFVPGRNILFFTVAAMVAYQKKCDVLVSGVCQTDYSGYPDCREEFVKVMSQTISLGMAWPLQIETPLMHLTKAQTVERMVALGKQDWYRYSHTCYEGKRPACGHCPACLLRLKGFQEAGVMDPLDYA